MPVSRRPAGRVALRGAQSCVQNRRTAFKDRAVQQSRIALSVTACGWPSGVVRAASCARTAARSPCSATAADRPQAPTGPNADRRTPD